ncbi:MAG: GldG family protein, partial [Candidatus Cloacimonetes bacterium]|nr:GldG family protein [Candidatus Cloacimonadota bacterium]
MKKIDKKSTLINLVIFIMVIIVINLISLNVFFRLDFSKGKIYSLAPSSKEVVKQLEDRMLVKAYFTEELPPQFANIRRYTKDLLEEYKTASKGKFRYEFINPTDENQLKEEAQKNGIPPVNVQVREQDRLEVREAFLGLVFHYNDKAETIPLVQETRGLEYEITRTINKISAYNIAKVAFYGLTPDLPDDPRLRMFMQNQDKFRTTKEHIRQNYELISTTLEEPLETNISTLVFSGILDSLSNMQLFNLDQFLMKGNNLIIFQDKVLANLQYQMVEPINSNIFELLEHYGIKIKDNLVLDAESGQVSVQEQRGIFSVSTPVQYPFIPISNTFNKKNPIVSQLNNLQYVFVSEIDTTVVLPNVNFTPLVYTSDKSSSIQGPNYDISIQRYMDKSYLNRLTQKNKIIAGLYEGPFVSYFKDKTKVSHEGYNESTQYAKIILVPDMEFIDNEGAGKNPGNMNFLM